ncbi:MAG: 3-deoxy-manno-octulosonate cytidylyltransferase [Halothiobacillaceae bacterium]
MSDSVARIPPYTLIIPARYASERLPGKPLVPIAGRPLIWHVYQRGLASGAKRVVIATDDERIEQACLDFGATVLMTRHGHESGTDRLSEAARLLSLSEDEIVVNLQGDEPLMPPRLLDQVARCLDRSAEASAASLMTPVPDTESFHDPACVKVVCDAYGRALYFSRQAIPLDRGAGPDTVPALAMRHLGVYAYRAGFLFEYADMAPCALESLERLEQLRILYHGKTLLMDTAVEHPGPGVDTPEDLARVRRLIEEGVQS